jgi:hypothetical protein
MDTTVIIIGMAMIASQPNPVVATDWFPSENLVGLRHCQKSEGPSGAVNCQDVVVSRVKVKATDQVDEDTIDF